jgi:hypothetical protein
MAMALDADIDRLYQLPLSTFTAARNELAKAAGARGAEIRKLEKPNAAAWAVNQVYWHHRDVFTRLVRASEDLRKAHARKIAGKDADVAHAEARHGAAIEAARRAAGDALTTAGDARSASTMAAIEQTLQAVPAPDVNGRLVRPIRSIGFAALAGLLSPGRGPQREPADVIAITPRQRDAPAGEAAGDRVRAARERREAEARRRARERAARELRDAQAREKTARAAFEKARQAVARADEHIERLEAQLQEARNAAGAARDAADRAQQAINAATSARVGLERRVRELA